MNRDQNKTPLQLRLLAQLDIAAASGIAVCNGELCVLADDELALARYDRAGVRTGTHVLLSGELPDDHKERKARKPDFEALVALPDGSLLALGSGSTAARRQGAWLRIEARATESKVIDLSALYARLERELPELNIEGGAVLHDVLFLCSRGNGPRRDNALIRIDWPRLARGLVNDGRASAEALLDIAAVQLGALGAEPLSLTDLAVAAEQLLFSATAEATTSTYEDGPCVGSALGVISTSGAVVDLVAVTPLVKIEGLWATTAGPALDLLLVADPDDRSARAPLMAATYYPPGT